MAKGKPLEVLNIDAHLGLSRNRVHRIGLELEGGWSALKPGANVVRDGSVVFDTPTQHHHLLRYIGEMTSAPMEVMDKKGWSPGFLDYVTSNYPTLVNDTCGMHIHMSFISSFAYQRLMTPAYPGTMVEYLRRWATRNNLPQTNPIWERLSGGCRYCQHIFYAEEQTRHRSKDYDQRREGHRYTVINYCWARYQTLECRLLPMMPTPSLAISAIQEVVNITNAFLRATAKREGKLAREEKVTTTHIVTEELSTEEKRSFV